MSFEWPQYYRPQIVRGASQSGRLSSYSIALEAWRRGLRVTFTHPLIRYYTISDGTTTIDFDHSRASSMTTSQAYRMVENKYKTSLALRSAGIRAPNTTPFIASKSDFSEVATAAERIGYPVVLKPLSGSRGRGVLANIANREELEQSHDWLINEFGETHFILERFYDGDDHRVYVVGGTCVAAGVKIPAHVVGDGVHSISQLIKTKNTMRKRNPFQSAAPISRDYEVDNYVTSAGYTYESVPPAGAHVRLRGKANVSAGGDFEDRTDELPEHIKEVAVKTVAAIPGLTAAGVDILYDPSKKQGEDYVVIELNSRAHIGLNMYPNQGIGRDVPEAIIDKYFPHSRRLDIFNLQDLRINLTESTTPIKQGHVSAVTVQPIPDHGLPVRRIFSLQDTVHLSSRQRSGIFATARKHSISGFLNPNKSALVVGGETSSISSFCERVSDIAGTTVSRSREWTGTLDIGFSIMGSDPK